MDTTHSRSLAPESKQYNGKKAMADKGSKYTKAESNYVPHAKKNLCESCKHYRNGTCAIVQGSINPDGHCDFYAAKSSVRGKK